MSEQRPEAPRFEVVVTVDGKDVPLKPFLHDMLGGAIVGLVSGLKNVADPQTVDIQVKRRDVGDS